MENINLKLHTVVLLIGPSNAGKSYFSKNFLIPGIEKSFAIHGLRIHKPVISYISSDDCRRESLGDKTAHKYESRMLQVSEKAFKTLHQRIDTAMEYPHNAHFIIVDTTGLDENFRKRVIAQAKSGNYNVAAVVFDYKNGDEYFRHVDDASKDKRILFKHLEKLRKNVWKTINRDTYDQIFKIKSKDFDQYPVSISSMGIYESCFLDPTLKYDVIGDVHGCLDELKELLYKLGYTSSNTDDGMNFEITPPPGRGLVFVGDLIDKGPESKKLLEIVHAHRNEPWLKVVKGNHENFVFKYLSGTIKDSGIPEDVRKSYFDTTEKFAGDQEALDMLKDLVVYSVPFAIHPHFIVTHAPCEAKYLGKLDRLSVKAQRGQYRVPRRSESPDIPAYIKAMESNFSWLKTEGVFNAPMHIFGHVSLKNCLWLKNKVGIDTGCSAGGRLSSVSINVHGGKPYFAHVASRQPAKEEMVDLFRRTEGPVVDLNDLTPREYGRIMWAAKDKINFVSGTIAPSDADKDTNNLESLDKALDYYASHGVESVVLQPKYMGSRCNVYLSNDPKECFAISRNGYKIKHVEMGPVFHEMREQFKDWLKSCKLLVLDGELMPWHAMGSGLIDEQYKVVEIGLESEFAILKATGFEDLVARAKQESKDSGFDAEKNNVAKEELYKKYGQAKAHTWRCLESFPEESLDARIEALAVYKEQIRLFGSSGEVQYKPFAILKIVDLDGVEVNNQAVGQSNLSQFEFVSKDECVFVTLSSEASRSQAHEFFNKITADQKMEGIVVKPEYITAGVAPALKVRGPNYLTLVYGYDYLFPSKHKRLIESKRTVRKIRTSIQEFNLGQKLLDIKQSEITEQNEAYLQLMANMILEEKNEKTLDPRL